MLTALAGGLMFSCTAEVKEDDKKEEAPVVTAEEKKVDEATSSAIHDLHENAASVKAEIKDIESGLEDLESEINDLLK